MPARGFIINRFFSFTEIGIGEEGLDIGQVDLIVNFDCLSSPIRMVQRTGRTGRKRSGRVVSLVSEGAEENRLRTSEAETRRLWNALKSPDAFVFVKDIPLLPEQPLLVRKIMNIVNKYRLSQVGGHSQKRKHKRKAEPATNDTRPWKLSNSDELRREKEYGRCNFNSKLYKEVIKAWRNGLNCYERVPKSLQTSSAQGQGLSSLVLRKMEAFTFAHSSKNLEYSTSSPVSGGRRNLYSSFSVSKDDSSAPGSCDEVYHTETEDYSVHEDDAIVVFSPLNDLSSNRGFVTDTAEIPHTNSNKPKLNDIFGCALSGTEPGLSDAVKAIVFGGVTFPVDPPDERRIESHVIFGDDDDAMRSVAHTKLHVNERSTKHSESPKSIDNEVDIPALERSPMRKHHSDDKEDEEDLVLQSRARCSSTKGGVGFDPDESVKSDYHNSARENTRVDKSRHAYDTNVSQLGTSGNEDKAIVDDKKNSKQWLDSIIHVDDSDSQKSETEQSICFDLPTQDDEDSLLEKNESAGSLHAHDTEACHLENFSNGVKIIVNDLNRSKQGPDSITEIDDGENKKSETERSICINLQQTQADDEGSKSEVEQSICFDLQTEDSSSSSSSHSCLHFR